jgi:hypothetical protein
MQFTPLLDRVGRRRSPATTSSFHEGRAPRNKGLRYPPDPPTVDEIIAVMRAAAIRETTEQNRRVGHLVCRQYRATISLIEWGPCIGVWLDVPPFVHARGHRGTYQVDGAS